MKHKIFDRISSARALIATAAVLASLPMTTLAQDAQKGEAIFNKCKACHQIGEGAKNRIGPVLTGVVGRPAGSYEDFRYSKSMKSAGVAGLVWDEALLFDYLADPTAFLRVFLEDSKAKAKMSFRLKDEQDRRDVIAYLETFSTIKADATAVCTHNGSNERHFFAAETTGQVRVTGWLEPGERLCAPAKTKGEHGVVSVFYSTDVLEGCSRIVRAGEIEDLLRYADFDRCRWSSHRN